MEGRSEESREQILRLDGPLTIQQAEGFKSFLLEALSRSDRLVLDFTGVKEVDLSCLQLLCAAHRASARMKKRLVLKEEGEVLKKVVGDAGFSRHEGCVKDPGQPCLWMKGAE